MGTPTRLQNVDDRGYVFMTEAADCQIVTNKVLVSNTTATLLPSTPLTARRRMYIKNFGANGTDKIYVGGPDVTTTNGWPLAQFDELILDVTDDLRVYAIGSINNIDTRRLEVS